MAPKRQGDYMVGKGKPPKHSQFKPGVSGNPSGRPKGTKNAIERLCDAMERTVVIRISGKAEKMSVAEALTIRIVEAAMQGDIKKAKFLLNNEDVIVENSAGRKLLPASISLEEAAKMYRASLKLGQAKLQW